MAKFGRVEIDIAGAHRDFEIEVEDDEWEMMSEDCRFAALMEAMWASGLVDVYVLDESENDQ